MNISIFRAVPLLFTMITLIGCSIPAQLPNPSGAPSILQESTQAIQTPAAVASSVPTPTSDGLIGLLMQQLGVTQAQAQGGTGALLQLAQSRMSPGDFTALGNSIPNMQSIMAAAPTMNTSELGISKSLAGMTGSNIPGADNGMLGITGAFQQLGLAPDMVQKFIPVITQFVQGNGGGAVSSALQSALMRGL